MTEWRKSSRSNTSGGDCVEVASVAGNIGIRDSKDPGGGHLTVTRGNLGALVARIKAGDLEL